MRVLCLALALCMILPSVAAQTLSSEDVQGDVDHKRYGTDAPDDAPYADLVAASITELQDEIEFTIQFASFAADRPEMEARILAGIHFDYQGQGYAARLERSPGSTMGTAPWFRWDLSYYDARLPMGDYGAYNYIPDARATRTTVDETTATLTAAFDRALVHGLDGSPMNPGGIISNMTTITRGSGYGFYGTPPGQEIGDRMPDQGVAPGELIAQFGTPQAGTARLESGQSFRISNGEATTFLFRIEAFNDADDFDSFTLVTNDLPPGWAVTIPNKRIELSGQASMKLPILVTVPFNHAHGTVQAFHLEMHSQTDIDSVGRLELGVRYTEIPQPAGHHDSLFIHALDDYRSDVNGERVAGLQNQYDLGIINTIEDDERATSVPIAANRAACQGGVRTSVIVLPLSPQLLMGLDFDLAREGLFEATFEPQIDLDGFMVEGAVYVMDPRYGYPYWINRDSYAPFIAAHVQPSETQAASAGQAISLELPINATEYGDYVPFDTALRMYMVLELEETSPAFTNCVLNAAMPVLRPGGRFSLPLDEYHDEVDDFFSAATGVELYSTELLRRYVNPGKAAIFNMTAENIGEETASFALSLVGSNPEWAQILGPSTIKVKPDQRVNIPIAVAIPQDAVDGSAADLTLIATRIGVDNVQSVLRFVAEVDTEVEHVDATPVIEEVSAATLHKESPLPVAWLLAGVLVALKRRR